MVTFLTGWDDVGDFSSLADLLPAEANQPRILGDNGLGMAYLFILQVCSNPELSFNRASRWGHRCAGLWQADSLLGS
jgi:hypothetical protein